MKLKSVILRTALAGFLAVSATAVQAETITLATGGSGGSYFPIGVQISTIVNQALGADEIQMTPVTTGGSAENVDLLQLGEAQMAVMMGLYGRDGITGAGLREGRPKVEKLRSIASLWQNVEQFVIRSSKVVTGDLSDMGTLGSQFSIGPRNSGTAGSGMLQLSALGIDADTAFTNTFMRYDAAAEAFQNRRIDGMFASSGVPTPSIAQAYVTAKGEVSILNVTDEQLAKINEAAGGLFTRVVIPAGSYEGQSEPIQAIQQPNFLAVSADVSDDLAYRITKAIFDNLKTPQSASSVAQQITLETALDGLPVPLHPGSIRFYEELGMDIPARLRP